MCGDSRFDILREVGIDSRRGVGGHQGDALGDLAVHGFRRPDDSDRVRVPLDDDLGSSLDPLQDRPYIFGQVAFADVQRLHTWDHSASSGQKVATLYHCNGLIVKRTVYAIGPDGKIRFAKRGMPAPAEVLAAA
jgi:hypothetical protein